MWGDCAARYMAAAAACGRSTHGFNLLPTIIKADDDLIQEAFALQVYRSASSRVPRVCERLCCSWCRGSRACGLKQA
jgi:hypothetical protein